MTNNIKTYLELPKSWAEASKYLHLMRMKNVILASITVPLGAQFAVGDSWLSEQFLEVTTQILAVIFLHWCWEHNERY